MLSLRCQSYTTFTQQNENELDKEKLGEEVGQQCNIYIFQSEDEMSQNISKLCYGNLYVIGSLWIEGMKKVMVGKRMCVVPKINAANNRSTAKEQAVVEPHTTSECECIPMKPPHMSYSELPIYYSPHRDYKEYENSTWYRPECNTLLLQRKIYPYVRQARINIQRKSTEAQQEISEMICVLRYITARAICGLQEHLRNPCNKAKAKACVALSTATGVVLGAKKGVLKAFLYGGLGALTSGALCFPTETDMVFRYACYSTWTLVTKRYGICPEKNIYFNGKIPRPNNIPECPEEESRK